MRRRLPDVRFPDAPGVPELHRVSRAMIAGRSWVVTSSSPPGFRPTASKVLGLTGWLIRFYHPQTLRCYKVDCTASKETPATQFTWWSHMAPCLSPTHSQIAAIPLTHKSDRTSETPPRKRRRGR